MKTLTAQEGLRWAIEYFSNRGMRLQPNDEHNMLVAWNEFVKVQTAPVSPKSDKPVTAENLSGGFVGFTTGNK